MAGALTHAQFVFSNDSSDAECLFGLTLMCGSEVGS